MGGDGNDPLTNFVPTGKVQNSMHHAQLRTRDWVNQSTVTSLRKLLGQEGAVS